jgi:hypothetical protein
LGSEKSLARHSIEWKWCICACKGTGISKEVEMSKSIFGILGLVVLLGALFAFGETKEASAEVNININLGPPPIVVAEPLEVVLIPGSRVYFVPHPEIDVFFYNGYWWSPRGSQWYRARAYNGPWKIVERRYIPAPVYKVPKDYRIVYEREKHIPYGQWKKQGKHQEKEERKDMKEDKHGSEHGNKKN